MEELLKITLSEQDYQLWLEHNKTEQKTKDWVAFYEKFLSLHNIIYVSIAQDDKSLKDLEDFEKDETGMRVLAYWKVQVEKKGMIGKTVAEKGEPLLSLNMLESQKSLGKSLIIKDLGLKFIDEVPPAKISFLSLLPPIIVGGFSTMVKEVIEKVKDQFGEETTKTVYKNKTESSLMVNDEEAQKEKNKELSKLPPLIHKQLKNRISMRLVIDSTKSVTFDATNPAGIPPTILMTIEKIFNYTDVEPLLDPLENEPLYNKFEWLNELNQKNKLNMLLPHVRKLVFEWIDKCMEAGVKIYITVTFRSEAEQKKAFEKGKSDSKIPYWHGTGRAIDFAIYDKKNKPNYDANNKIIKEQYTIAGKIAENMGFRWLGYTELMATGTGKPFQDPYHIEFREGLTPQESWNRYKSKIDVSYLNLDK